MAAERRRWQVPGLLADRAPIAEIAAATGYRPRTIREIAMRYCDQGAPALADQRAQSVGAPPVLTAALQHELWDALQRPPSAGGRWTGPKVARWIATKTGKPAHRQRGWEYLRRFEGAAEPMRDLRHTTHADAGTEDGAARCPTDQ